MKYSGTTWLRWPRDADELEQLRWAGVARGAEASLALRKGVWREENGLPAGGDHLGGVLEAGVGNGAP